MAKAKRIPPAEEQIEETADSSTEDTTEDQRPSLVRLAYMFLYAIIGRFVSMIVFFASIFQYIYAWIFGKPNEQVLAFTEALSTFAKEIIAYLALNTEEKPWPIGEWPKK